MFWWGGWLLFHFPSAFTFRGYMISMWALFISIMGLMIAFEGVVDHEEAKKAAARIFETTDRISKIDPLGDEGTILEVEHPEFFQLRYDHNERKSVSLQINLQNRSDGITCANFKGS